MTARKCLSSEISTVKVWLSEIEAMAYGSYFAVPVDMMETLKGDVVIHNHPSGVLTPSEEDIELSALLANAKIGFYIVDNNCQSVNVVVKTRSARLS